MLCFLFVIALICFITVTVIKAVMKEKLDDKTKSILKIVQIVSIILVVLYIIYLIAVVVFGIGMYSSMMNQLGDYMPSSNYSF